MEETIHADGSIDILFATLSAPLMEVERAIHALAQAKMNLQATSRRARRFREA
jgi:hypothetical protein